MAWCLDEAVYIYGMGVEDAMERAKDSAPTPQMKQGSALGALQRMLSVNPFKKAEEQAPQKFADPAALAASGKLKIKKG